jgi:hypothetical protein
MTSAALQDLSNRIASNTLTGLQQAALVQALAILIPTFPSPDELSNGIPPTEEVLARDWIAPLYTLQAEASGGASVLPTAQIAWFVNPLTGSDTNDGASPATALATVSQIGVRWRGVSGGGRPRLFPATGNTITINILAPLNVVDTLSNVLDVDLEAGMQLNIFGAPTTVAHTGTLATASAFARTSAGGQIAITDGTVADYGPLVGTASLFTDTTTGAVAWLYSPVVGSSATGIVSKGKAAQVAGTPSFPADVAIAGGNAYTLQDVMVASLGEGFVTRSFPLDGASGGASVFFHRLHFIEAEPSNNGSVLFQSPTVTYTAQECEIDHSVLVYLGGVALVNCFTFEGGQLAAEGGQASLELYAGVYQGLTSGQVLARLGAFVIVDGDFALASGAPFGTVGGAFMLMGAWSRWNNGGTNALDVSGGTIVQGLQIAGISIGYGTATTDFAKIESSLSNAGAILFGTGSTAVAQFQFGATVAFTNGVAGASGFTFDDTAGTFTGPTTNTLAHLDAVAGAGTGFGGVAIDPSSGGTFRKAA